MSIGIKLFTLLSLIASLFIVGITVFASGFLLHRLEITTKRSCVDDTAGTTMEGAHQDCGAYRRYRRAIVIVVDALRYDFAAYNESLESDLALPFQNKFPFMHKLRTEKPQNSLLCKFIADPPTTTLQRLKGLTTGSLPTFVDAGSNFASSEIAEDNFVYQLFENGRKVTFMGDDTWESLFTGKFTRSFPYPSFNVKDLHTVDNGVIDHLIPEMAENDWDVIIAHLLGVDHCGHRLGPYHSAMGEKLAQMDQLLRSVVERLDNDTVLFMLGDHGMTHSGDHGGDGTDETEAALFMYSHSPLHQETHDMEAIRVTSQIDFVPTFSLLLGLPIPFSNLGSLIPELFTLAPSRKPSLSVDKAWSADLRAAYSKATALHTNAHQVNAYLAAYSKISGDFPQGYFAQLQKMLHDADFALAGLSEDQATRDRVVDASSVYMDYLSGVKTMCRHMWARFDMTLIVLGLAIVIGTFGFSRALLTYIHNFTDRALLDSALATIIKIFVCTLVACIAISSAMGFYIPSLRDHSTVLMLTVPPIGCLLNTTIWIVFLSTEIKLSVFVNFWTCSKMVMSATILSAAYMALLSSNSFVVNEGHAARYLTNTLQLICVCSGGASLLQARQGRDQARKKSKAEKSRDIGHILTHPVTRFAALVVAFHACVRLSGLFLACREEQGACQESELLRPLETFSDDSTGYRNYRYLLSVACLAAIPASLTFWLNKQGNLNGGAAPMLSMVYLLPFTTVCICLNWGLQALPQKMLDSLPPWQQVLMPRLAYTLLLLAFLSVLWNPLCIYLVPRDDKKPKLEIEYPGQGETVAPKLFNHLKSTWKRAPRQNSHGDEEGQLDSAEAVPPVVYGLGTVYSSAWLLVSAAVALFVALLLGDGLAPAVLTMLMQTVVFLEMYAVIRRQQIVPLEVIPDLHYMGMYQVPWYAIVAWGLMSSQYFFATGHHATIPSIRFQAAFTGFHGDFPPYLFFVPALLVTVNTFASQIFFATALPLLLIWPFTRGRMFDRTGKTEDRKGELCLHISVREMRIAFFQLILSYMLFHATQLIGSMFAAAYHRRHLMVWKIFAPRFIFQGISFGVTVAVLLLSYLLIVKIDRAVSRWLQVLLKET